MSEQHKRHSPPEQETTHVAFLVRYRRDGGQWRFMLENVATREKRGFDSFDAFCLYIAEILKVKDGYSS